MSDTTGKEPPNLWSQGAQLEIERLLREIAKLRQERDAEIHGILKLREELGAKDDETFPDFVRRLRNETRGL